MYHVPLPAPGEAKRAILDTYTKEHSAEYQSQALIDLAFRMGKRVKDWDAVDEIVIQTSHHTHYVIGTGANDPQKLDPTASAARRSTIRSCISSPSRCRMARGTTCAATLPERAQRPDTVRAMAQDPHRGRPGMDRGATIPRTRT